MRCTPYGYCMCQYEATCTYPDCRVGDMLAGCNDDSPPAGQMAVAAPEWPYQEPLRFGTGARVGLGLSLLAWAAMVGSLVWWW